MPDSSPAPSTFTDGFPLPKLFIYDLDYTLWPFWVDTHVTPPLKANKANTAAIDRTGESFTFYRDVPSILHATHSRSMPIALASRTHAPDLAMKLLNLLRIPGDAKDSTENTSKRALDFFTYRQIYPGDKKTHMNKLNKESGIEFEDMLFFDDESRNRNVESLGVCFHLVRDGTTRAEVDAGVREWRKRRGITGA